jgi:hypothetical protein
MVAIRSKTAADVRTGHITDHTAGDESYRSTEKRPGSRPEGHVVYPLSSVCRSRQQNRGGDDCDGKKISHDRTPSLRAGAGPSPRSPPPRLHINVKVAKEFQSNQKLFHPPCRPKGSVGRSGRTSTRGTTKTKHGRRRCSRRTRRGGSPQRGAVAGVPRVCSLRYRRHHPATPGDQAPRESLTQVQWRT